MSLAVANAVKARFTGTLRWAVLTFALCASISQPAMASRGEGLGTGRRLADEVPPELAAVAVDEHLGAPVDPSLSFRAEDGSIVRLGDLLTGDIPTLVTLNYFTCETLCSFQLNAVLEGLKQLDWVAGKEFRVVTVSIDPKEDAALARTKKASYLEALGKGDVEWRFLTGEQASIEALASTLGFGYSYDERSGQYAHPAVIMVLSPEGNVARYLYGISYTAMDIKFALMEAAAGRVGSPAEKLVLSCFQYDESSGRYTPFAFGIMRLGGLATVLVMGLVGVVLWRRELFSRGDGSVSR